MGGSEDEDRPRVQRVGSVAVVPIYGVLTKRANMMTRYSGGTSVDLLARELQSLADDSSVEAVVLDCNSPGGECSGVADCAEAVAALARKKRCGRGGERSDGQRGVLGLLGGQRDRGDQDVADWLDRRLLDLPRVLQVPR